MQLKSYLDVFLYGLILGRVASESTQAAQGHCSACVCQHKIKSV